MLVNNPFRPVSITLTFETKEEYEAFYEVCNHSSLIHTTLATRLEYEHELPVRAVLGVIYDGLHV